MNDYLLIDRLLQTFWISLGVSVIINFGLPFLMTCWQGTDPSEAKPLSAYAVILLSLFCGAVIGLMV